MEARAVAARRGRLAPSTTGGCKRAEPTSAVAVHICPPHLVQGGNELSVLFCHPAAGVARLAAARRRCRRRARRRRPGHLFIFRRAAAECACTQRRRAAAPQPSGGGAVQYRALPACSTADGGNGASRGRGAPEAASAAVADSPPSSPCPLCSLRALISFFSFCGKGSVAACRNMLGGTMHPSKYGAAGVLRRGGGRPGGRWPRIARKGRAAPCS